MANRYRLGIIFGLIALLSFPLSTSFASPTGHHVHPEFLSFYEQSGGLPVFGYAIAGALQENGRLVQYFERQRFEHHPEHAGTPYEVLLGHVGKQDAERRGLLVHEAFDSRTEGDPAAGADFFPQTGHSLQGEFRSYWHRHGLEFGDPGVSFRESLALFGYPISEEFVDPETGLRTQYFERARFEFHPEHAGTEHAVLLGHLGNAEWQRLNGEPALDDSQESDAPDVIVDEWETPSTSIQHLVNRASRGATVTVPAGVYRETVTIDKPLTLIAEPGAEIRGSDIWSDGWTRSGSYWVRGTVPDFGHGHGPCHSGESCRWQEQVFIDGEQLTQVASNPSTGEFAVNSRRQIVLADDPTGRLVEVTTRERWIVGRSSNVTIDGFRMRHAANRAQTGALDSGEHDNWTVQNSHLSHAHGANISLSAGSNLRLLDSEISFGGQLGVHSGGAWDFDNFRPVTPVRDLVLRGNRIHSNNTQGFSTSWEAGGIKATVSHGSVFENNEIFNNNGPGVWCDIDCDGVTISDNRVHHNSGPGIMYELSTAGQISGNKVWENGYAWNDWGWGAGILIQNSSHTVVQDNIVAWNNIGVSVISQDRGLSRWNNVRDNSVSYNDIFIVESGRGNIGIFWAQDWNGGLTDPSSNNRGAGNRYYHANPVEHFWTFIYGDHRLPWGELEQLNQSGGDSGARYLSTAEKDQILHGASVPLSPERAQ